MPGQFSLFGLGSQLIDVSSQEQHAIVELMLNTRFSVKRLLIDSAVVWNAKTEGFVNILSGQLQAPIYRRHFIRDAG